MLEQAIEQQRQTWIALGIDQEKQKIAKTLLAKGMERPWIAEVTGLSVEELLLLWQPEENHHALSP
jgi:predicted transposase/invertase (TIGR01784 family)